MRGSGLGVCWAQSSYGATLWYSLFLGVPWRKEVRIFRRSIFAEHVSQTYCIREKAFLVEASVGMAIKRFHNQLVV
jgi:hypothetical protein